MRRFVLCLLTFSALAAVSARLTAQIAGELRGTVSDPTGAASPKAHVRLLAVETNVRRETVTTNAGVFDFPQLVAGPYRVEVEAAGFKPLRRSNIVIATGTTVKLDVQLELGAADQAVEVTDASPALQSATSNIATTLPGTIVRALPLNGRNFIQLTTLAPGVYLQPGTLLPRINGGRPRTNEYLDDGISLLQPEPGQVAFFPIVDDIQEFTVQANNVSADFGRFNGGVVNIGTRSGTDEIHGSVYDYFRNDALNARNYFAPAGRKPVYRRNQYGGTLGLPIVRDRFFFFGGYQGQRFSDGVIRTSTLPTLAQRAGNFGDVAIYDPAATTVVNGRFVRRQFPNNTIDRPFDPAATALLARLPRPTNLNTAANNYTRVADDVDHQNQLDARVDDAFRDRDRIFGRYSYFHDVETPVTPLPDGSGVLSGSPLGTGNVPGPSNVVGQQAVLNETHIFGARALNNARLGYTRRGNTIAGPTLETAASQTLGIPGIPTNARFSNALPLFTIAGFQQIGPSASTFTQYQTAVWEFGDTFSWTRGRHSLRFGLDDRWYQLNAVQPPNPTGSFAFTTTGTDQQTAMGTTGGNAFASFLLGQVDAFSIDLQRAVIRPRDFIEEYFVQDDWSVTPRLTVNLGARWTLHHPSTEKTNQGAVFNLETQRLQYLGVDGFSRSARELHYSNLGPRLGVSYLVTPKTVVRSGFGIVFIDQSGITTPFTTPQFPFIQNVRQATQDNINAAFTLTSGPTVAPVALTPDAGLGQSVYTANRGLGSGYVQQWNLAVQRELSPSTSVEVAYVGSHIVHVGIPDANLNQLPAAQLALGSLLLARVPNPYFGQVPATSPLGARTIAANQLLRPYPRFQNVAYYRNNTGNTNYNAAEVKLEQQVSHGLSLLLSYTHSRLLDDASSVFSSTVLSSPNTSSLVAADTARPYLERDSSTGDSPNVTALSGTYLLPAMHAGGSHARAFASRLMNGWGVNAIASLASGLPVAVTQSVNNNSSLGFALQRPNVSGSTSLTPSQRTPARFFNAAVPNDPSRPGAFAVAPQFTLGNASRNPVRGPAYRDLDIAGIKHTAISERFDLEFRGEIFNVTNTPAFAQPNGSFGAAAFGSITSTAAEQRVVQFALKLSR